VIKVSYISEINLPSKSGYAHHVLKICDAFSKKFETSLYVRSSRINYKSLKKNYLLKKNFEIVSFEKEQKSNFLSRLFFVFFVIKHIDKNSLIISRSILSSLFLSVINVRNIIELHHPPTGLTSIIFFIIKILGLDKNLDYIFLHKNLKKIMKINRGIVLDDCVDTDDFKNLSNKKKYDFCYVGSLFKGKGLEIIIDLANKYKKKNFYVFGDLKSIDKEVFNLNKIYKISNLHLKNFKNYRDIPKILKSSEILLMPYLNNVQVNSKNLEVSNFMSPLKMFDYLASGQIILASNLNVYKHILKNKYNCFLVKKNNLENWFKLIDNFQYKKKFLKKMSKNALKTASSYTWDKRVNKIINFFYKK
tara:strand:- start:847 stop:1932 length:1086 start_codon:yes stop_codon:yes gene_type:complete